jgi:hypothetical protein
MNIDKNIDYTSNIGDGKTFFISTFGCPFV